MAETSVASMSGKKIILKCLVLCLVFALFTQAGVVKNHGALKVKGTKIVDSFDKPIQIAGMSLYWPEWGGDAFYTDNAVSTLTKNWGSSVVRAPIPVYTPNANPAFQYDAKYIGNVKTVIQAAINNDIYVIVDWHLEGDEPQPELAKSFFTDIAKTYGKYPNVIFEFWNEPINASWSIIKSYAETLLAVIRPYSSNLVLVGSGTWSQKLNDPIASPVSDPDNNVAYSYHFYACTHTQTARDFVTQSAAKIPIFFTEWGTTLSSGTGSFCSDESDKWLALAKNLGISWTNWSFSNRGGLSGALTGTSLDGLTESGRYVKGKIQEVAAAMDTSATPIKIDTVTVPGKIEAENYTKISSELQTETTTDQGGGSDLGYSVNGSWAEYVVKISKSGDYTLNTRVATANSGMLTFKLNNTQIGTLNITSTGDWQNWQTKEIPVTINSTGVATFRVEWSGTASSLINLNWIELVASGTSVQKKVSIKKPTSITAIKNGLSIDLRDGVRELLVIDTQGKTLYCQTIRNQGHIQIPLTNRGLVFVKIQYSDGTSVVPIMLSR